MPRRSKAFTLIEVLIVTGILVLLLPALLKSIVGYSMLNVATKNRVVAIADCRFVIEHMRGLSRTVTSPDAIIPVNWPDIWSREDNVDLSITYRINWVDWADIGRGAGLPPNASEEVLITYTEELGFNDVFDGDPLNDDPLAIKVTISWQTQEGRTDNVSFSTLMTMY